MGPTGFHKFCFQLRCMWGKSCLGPALLVPCATTAQWASYAISLLSKMRFGWVNWSIITIPEQMCVRCAAKHCRLQDKVDEFSATFQHRMSDWRQANRFAVSLQSVLRSLSSPPTCLPHLCDCQCHCDRDRSVCQPDKSAHFPSADCRQMSLMSKHVRNKTTTICLGGNRHCQQWLIPKELRWPSFTHTRAHTQSPEQVNN